MKDKNLETFEASTQLTCDSSRKWASDTLVYTIIKVSKT
jgi:hypothetical protein